MDVAFLKENIIKSRQNDKTGKNAVKLLKIDKQSEFLFEKNTSVFLEMIDFLKNNEDVWILSGYSLCGKSLLVSTIPQIMSDNSIFCFFKCTYASTLDDILLSFFETFKNYAQKGIVHVPKIDTKDFQERINFYLTNCENPVIIIIDGLNEIENSRAREGIMDFLSHIAELKNIKMIITSRQFDITDLKNIKLKVGTSIIKPLTLDKLKEYCLRNVIKSDGLEEFFKTSHGHYKNLNLMMNYIQPTNLTIKEFVDEANESKKSFEDFAITKNLSLIPDSYKNLLWTLSIANFGMPKENIMNLIKNDTEEISSLLKKGIIENVNDNIYIKDFYQDEILRTIEPLTQQTIKKAIIKFLETQLPLKPAERKLKLSRVTIRNEIERLTSAPTTISKKVEKNNSQLLNILGYAKQFKTNWDGFDDIIMPKKDSFEDLINKNVEKVEEQINPPEIEMVEKNEEEPTSLELAQKLKEKYAYKEALIQYSEALNQVTESKNTDAVISTLEDIAECYFKLGDYSNAVENYGKAHEIAKKYNLTNECYSIMIKIAEVYKVTYKQDLAKQIYTDILKNAEDIDEGIKLKAEINLFEASFALLKPKEIVEKYYDLLNKVKEDKALSSKIHFRLGFLYDKASELEEAELHYKKSIEICDDYKINQNLSSCYYNLAEINFENKKIDSALDYYLKSFAVDELMQKTEDLIQTTKKIAKIYERKRNDLALEYYEKAVDLAKGLKDNYPIACAYIDLGDYYYRRKDDLKALKAYMTAQKTMENQLTNENLVAITDRFNDLKVRLGKEVVEKIIKEFY